jgi:hypothetical protein
MVYMFGGGETFSKRREYNTHRQAMHYSHVTAVIGE